MKAVESVLIDEICGWIRIPLPSAPRHGYPV